MSLETLHLLVAVVVAIIVALLVFASLVLIGTVIVRRLRLPQELPEIPRFEPPPPPVRAHATPDEAKAVALVQLQRQAIGADALAAHRAAQACHELVEMVSDPAACSELTRLAAASAAAATTAEQALREADADVAARTARDQRDAAGAALSQARALVATIPGSNGRRRLLVLLVALLVALWLAWLLAMMVR